MRKKIAIVGFAREGKAVFKFIKTKPEFKDADIWILDRNKNTEVPKGLHSILGPTYLDHLEQFDLVSRTPGLPYNLPKLKAARKKGVPFTSLIALFFQYCPVPIVGVTGTKGKGTTSVLLYKMLKADHRNVHLAGNIGVPALEVLSRLKKNSLVILELSSFQLQGLAVSPHIAVVLDVFPDHLENIKTAEHGTHTSWAEYVAAKATIARYQKKNDVLFYAADNAASRAIAMVGGGKKIAVSVKKFKLFAPKTLAMPGPHNFKNAAMAATVARSLGVRKEAIIHTVKTFKGNEHRLEFVRKVRGVSFYNDSASTGPETTAAAILSFPKQNVTVIAGGHDKNLDYAPLAKALKKSKIYRVVLFGENKNKIAAAINKSGAPVMTAVTLGEAVQKAKTGADVVVFSPGSSSFDMFKNYADRGGQFKALVKKLK